VAAPGTCSVIPVSAQTRTCTRSATLSARVLGRSRSQTAPRCSGCYSYAGGHAPEFPGGGGRFGGRVVHPQFWPEDLDYAGKRVVVTGSGTTAVTIVPEMAKTAAHVTMLQRSPTNVVSRPSEDKIANWLRDRLPAKLAYRITRWKNVALGMHFYRLARKHPEKTRQQILAMVQHALGPDYDVATHFTPSYTETGIRLRSGAELKADIVVMATGLKLNLLGDVGFSLASGYVQRGLDMLPKQGSKRSWKLHGNYAMDAAAFRFGSVADGTMEFIRRRSSGRTVPLKTPRVAEVAR